MGCSLWFLLWGARLTNILLAERRRADGSPVAVIDLDHRRSFNDDRRDELIVRSALRTSQHRGGDAVARKAQRPTGLEEQVGAVEGHVEGGSVPVVETLANGDSGFAENAGHVAEREDDSVAMLVVRREKRCSLPGPLAA